VRRRRRAVVARLPDAPGVLFLLVAVSVARGDSGRIAGTHEPHRGRAAPVGLAARGPDSCRVPADSLRAILRASNAYHGDVGEQTVILRGGRVAFRDAWGTADLESGTPVTDSTLFFVASVTKAFTAAALLRLRDAGHIDLDADVRRYVPALHPPPEGTVTPRLLAAHLAGIRHYREKERDADFFAVHFDDVRDALARFAGDPYASAPGTAFLYSSYGYDLLAATLQEASGRPFPFLVRTSVFEPLGLEHTRFDDARVPIPGRARGYTYWVPWFSFTQHDTLFRAPRWDYSYNMGGGDILSTASDLARLGEAFVHAGFLSERSLALTRKVVRSGGVASRWSIGWSVDRDPAGRLHLRSEGSDPGFQASIDVYPDEDVVVATTLNSWGRRPAKPAPVADPLRRITELCLGW
jgi:CubicO group peptidase (beta-lactamase class C family)